jgi:hypothetical protein
MQTDSWDGAASSGYMSHGPPSTDAPPHPDAAGSLAFRRLFVLRLIHVVRDDAAQVFFIPNLRKATPHFLFLGCRRLKTIFALARNAQDTTIDALP